MEVLIRKLTQARQELATANLKKTGKNAHMGFTYYELSDFLPKVIELEAKYEMISFIEMDNEKAILTITDGNTKLQFSCPFVMADLKNTQPTQNLGASISYIKRYLYCLCYCIEESKDVLDATLGSDYVEPIQPEYITEAQKNAIFRMNCNIENICKKYNVPSIDDLTKTQASEVIKIKQEQIKSKYEQ